MNSTPINNHVAQALGRLLAQYQDKPRLAALLTALVEQIQDLEDVLNTLDDGKSIFHAVGQQLDNIGTIVNIDRNGLDDDQYRLFLLGKIGENTSNATADKVDQVYALLLNSDSVQEQDLPPAAAGFLAASFGVPANLINIIYELVQLSLGAGIRLDFLAIFEEGDAFAMEGGPPGLGFDDLGDPGHGGKFGTLLFRDVPFAFASNDPSDPYGGFGDLADSYIGGNFVSL